MKFSHNAAVTASSVYLNNLDLCSWVQGEPDEPWFEPSGVFNWTFIEFRSAKQLSGGIYYTNAIGCIHLYHLLL